MLVIARTVQGAFGAFARPFGTGSFDHDVRRSGRAWKGVWHLRSDRRRGRGIGLLLGGILTSYVSWRWTLFVNLAFAAAAVAGALLWLNNDQGADHDPSDLPGLLLVGIGLFSLVFGFSHAETTAWSNHYTIGSLAAGVVLLAVFAFIETRTKYPLLPPRIVLNRTRGGSLLVALFASVGIFGVFLFLTYYLQETLGYSPIKSGVAFLPLIAVLIAVAQVSNRILLPRFGPKPMVPLGLLVSAAGLLGLREVGLHSAYVSHVLPFLIVLGIGSGLSVSPSFSTGTLGLAPQDAGVGSAALNTAQQVGGSIGTALLNTLAASAATSYLVGRVHSAVAVQTAVLRSDTTAFVWSASAFVVGAIVASLVLERGVLAALAPQHETATVEVGSMAPIRTEVVPVPIACRAC